MSRDAKLLVRTARRVERGPDEDARARMRKHVLGAIGASAALGGASSASAAGVATATASGTATGGAAIGAPAVVAAVAKTSLFVKAIGALAVVGALGGGAAFIASKNDPATPAAQVATPAVSTVQTAEPRVSEPSPAKPAPEREAAVPSPVASEEVAAVPTVSNAPSAVARPSAAVATASVSADPLKEETDLLVQAQSALGQGDAVRALAITDDHAARFPNGVLVGERKAVRALALCKAGRKDEGRAEAQPLVARAPDSPLAQRVAAACR